LLGINSTNLVNPAAPVKPKLNELPTFNLYKKEPVVMPYPLKIEKNQRPFPTPN